ncbi:MAG: hypothetical protein BIFFINMI_01167 [Phycisphaerae bacterium]|nr:hypothetical protein [Phycisphaerae bacterium]
MKQNLVIGLAAALLTGLLFGLALHKWGRQATSGPSTAQDDSRPKVPYTPVPQAERFHGVAIQIHNADKKATYERMIREVRQTGADSVLLAVKAFQEDGSSSTIHPDTRQSPDPDQTEELIRYARSLGLRVIVMPIVLLDHPRETEWRGRIQPNDPERWWADYRDVIRFYAAPAHRGGASVFMIGSELNKMEDYPSRWRDLIRFVRKNYPGLKLGYSANWDRYKKVQFWWPSQPGADDGLDCAGITTYFELAHDGEWEPSVDSLVKAWDDYVKKGVPRHYKQEIEQWHEGVGIPVIFTEVGWYSRKGAAFKPWDYYYNKGKVSMVEQRNLYDAFIRVWGDNPAVGGIFFWDWSEDTGGPDDEYYTPRGKPAERVMSDWFARAARPTTQPDSPPQAPTTASSEAPDPN